MKSLFLIEIKKPELLWSALSQELSAKGPDWILSSAAGDPIAYFSIVHEQEKVEVQADISGRHYHEDETVEAVLKRIALTVGGIIRNEESA